MGCTLPPAYLCPQIAGHGGDKAGRLGQQWRAVICSYIT